ncbi:MAG TPA: hypothetical protein VFX59_11950 [Polyangiales bacterium]|nr:hypothetical protein [Polyangiales bacterium]
MLASLRARLDAIGVSLALLFGLPTLGYAFGRDQALFCYVGREWVAGRLPYVEAFDVKPPSIYAIYALAGELLGFQLWSIRVLELFAVLALGVCIALAVRRDRALVRGELGAVVLLTSAAYFTVFDYWDTGQAELWEGLLALLGYLVAERMRKPLQAAVIAGLLGGVALMFKMTVAVVLPIAGCVIVFRAYREKGARAAAIALAVHCAAATAVVSAVLAYFALRGGWPALVELAHYTATYVRLTSSPTEAQENLAWLWQELIAPWTLILVALFAVGVGLTVRRRALTGPALALLLTLASICSVAVQGKYWAYHWVVVAPLALLCAAYGLSELARLRADAVLPVALLVAALGLSTTPHWGTSETVTYASYTQSFWSYLRGSLRRSEFLVQFTGPFGYDYALEERVGDLIGELAKPGDQLQVRGFEPAIYVHARLGSPSRFASEAPIAVTSSATWAAEHERSLWAKPPRFFVTYAANAWDIDAIKAHGYHPIGQLHRFLWLEHAP